MSEVTWILGKECHNFEDFLGIDPIYSLLLQQVSASVASDSRASDGGEHLFPTFYHLLKIFQATYTHFIMRDFLS